MEKHHHFTIKCCFQRLFFAYYQPTEAYNDAICILLGYVTQTHPDASFCVHTLVTKTLHPHTITWGQKEISLDEAKLALQTIISSQFDEEKQKERELILSGIAEKMPEFAEVTTLVAVA